MWSRRLTHLYNVCPCSSSVTVAFRGIDGGILCVFHGTTRRCDVVDARNLVPTCGGSTANCRRILKQYGDTDISTPNVSVTYHV